MKILQTHNYYQRPGGEDGVVAAEKALLLAHGHEVAECTAHNEAIKNMGRLEAAARTIWNPESYRQMIRRIDEFRPDVAHVHNTFPLLSPAVYYACRRRGVPVVQTLHNYRLFCLNAFFYRERKPCESCVGHFGLWPGIRYKCYRESRSASVALAAMLTVHRLLRTWTRCVDAYIALSRFSRDKFMACGLPAEKVRLKPNFIFHEVGVGPEPREKMAVFVGRLSSEKGIETLVRAWEQAAPRTDGRLIIYGDGPCQELVTSCTAPRLEFRGWAEPEVVRACVKQAQFLVFSSEWYETFGLSAVEAFSAATPVLAGRLGVMTGMIRDGETGRFFKPADPVDLADKLVQMFDDPEDCRAMGRAARREYEEQYTANRNYEMLIQIYEEVIAQKARERDGEPIQTPRA